MNDELDDGEDLNCSWCRGYSTEERAWRAMRREVEDRAAAKLAAIDAAIAHCTP